MSARAELARRVLETLAQGGVVPFNEAIQLRNCAVRIEDITLSLIEIAHGILDQEEDQKTIAENMADAKRIGAEFIMTDLELAFTFLKIVRTSRVTATVRRNQRNARTAYDVVLRFLPRSLLALSATERESIEGKLRELKNCLKQLGENLKNSN
jgi:hypothetical protein